MKRFMGIILAFLLLLPLSGCKQSIKPISSDSDNKISIVCTVFPQYDWVYQILGNNNDDAEVTLLLGNGIDIHNYQPSVNDIVKISTCDLFIYVGGESDKWVSDALKSATNSDMTVINLLNVLGVSAKVEEIVKGMEGYESHEDHEGHEDHEDEQEYDEHVWLSLKNAELFCSVITDALVSLNAGKADEYKDNLALYTDKLRALDEQYQMVINAGSTKTLLFGDRFPFRYLIDDYGLSYHAAFPGCSAETEASFSTIIFLAEMIDDLGIHAILVTESSDQAIAKTIRNSTKSKNQSILVLDSIQSVTASNTQNMAAYLSVMESNLNVLRDALK